MRHLLLTATLLLASVLFMTSTPSSAQSSLACNSVVEGAITVQDAETGHLFDLQLDAGDEVTLELSIPGSSLRSSMYILDSSGSRLERETGYDNPKSINSFVAPFTGDYQVLVKEWESREMAYTLTVDCIQINADSSASTSEVQSQVGPQSTSPAFGFPGLPAVDFASAVRIPLTFDTPTQSGFPPSSDAVLGFTFEANADDVLDLSFERRTGNLNIGLVVLSADNQVVYMAALISSQTNNSRFTLPSTGEYTIGMFRIDLVTLASPEATDFTITATLNP
jgi:hypothetical protein